MKSLVIFGTEDDPGLVGKFTDCLYFGLDHGVIEQEHGFGVGMFEEYFFLGYFELAFLYQVPFDQIHAIGSLASDQCHFDLFF